MDIQAQLIQALDAIEEPPAQPSAELLAVAGRHARSRRRRRSGLGITAVLGVGALAMSASGQGWFSGTSEAGGVSVASAGVLPSGEVPGNIRHLLQTCGAMIDPADDRVYLAGGATVLRRADAPIDPAVAPYSIALEVRLASGQIRWIGAGWEGPLSATMGAGCDDPRKPGADRTFDDYVENLWDGNGMKLP